MKLRRHRFTVLGTYFLVIATVASVGAAVWRSTQRSTRDPAQRYMLAAVKRGDLFPSMTASGRVESSVRTVVECELENITIGVLGQPLSAGGASVLLSIVPEGTMVKKGDVLATLDSSDYEELLRQQRITVERSRADFRTAELNVEIAKLAVREFRDGSMVEAVNDFRRTIAMAQADMVRVDERLSWSRRMLEKGYVPKGQVIGEEFNRAKAEFALSQERAALDLFTKWTAPTALRRRQVAVLGAEATLAYQRTRLARNLERLAKLEKQVERCTIHAEHDGLVIYANDERRNIHIEPGIYVRQRQDLMYLPDLTSMEVVTALHESLVKTVEKGMHAKIYVEGLPDRRFEGHVTTVAAIPTPNLRSDVRYFDSTVRLDHAPKGLLPGMTARVEIDLERRNDVLTVPAMAVTREQGHEYCYVVHDEGLERREVTLGEGTKDLLEISEGLKEGESVVLNPVLSEVEQDTIAVAEQDSPVGTASTAPKDAAELVSSN
ncbi:efflux RND transporter periplasmic adaptor subunit [Aquisphaera insulae]|uniref:efflux RND transporter periplasmic adaptor subunit n=1 Tax=Aquisphaera insulae TaxID=2712864 RepID=UPI0013EB9462|nr:efflux RND transporter periplasmic adaptor subunit [Aquisphaera insulae]